MVKIKPELHDSFKRERKTCLKSQISRHATSNLPPSDERKFENQIMESVRCNQTLKNSVKSSLWTMPQNYA
jgi:hypothetical protein